MLLFQKRGLSFPLSLFLFFRFFVDPWLWCAVILSTFALDFHCSIRVLLKQYL